MISNPGEGYAHLDRAGKNPLQTRIYKPSETLAQDFAAHSGREKVGFRLRQVLLPVKEEGKVQKGRSKRADKGRETETSPAGRDDDRGGTFPRFPPLPAADEIGKATE